MISPASVNTNPIHQNVQIRSETTLKRQNRQNESAFLRTNTIKFGRVWRYNKLNKSEEERRRADDLHGNV